MSNCGGGLYFIAAPYSELYSWNLIQLIGRDNQAVAADYQRHEHQEHSSPRSHPCNDPRQGRGGA